MSKSKIVIEAEKYVTQLLSEKLNSNIKYHNLKHTLAVRNASMQIASLSNLSETEREIVELACLFHDTGITEIYQEHEKISARIALEFLQSNQYPSPQIQLVLGCIETTYPNSKPKNSLEEIVRDADYAHLGSPDYSDQLEALRQEWELMLNQKYEDREWYRLNLDFIKNHNYITSPAKMTFEAMKELNRKKMKKWLKEGKSPAKEFEEDRVSIVESRSSQMMFKTALRNHMDLSNLADNKANIMLTVNALIITTALPNLFVKIETHWELWVPFIGLLCTCLASMISATLATVPIKMTGTTSLENIRAGRSNLFFFGNFFNMSYDEYRAGIRVVTSSEDNLEDSIMRDLYFLGLSLGKKYRQLRTCYIIFMIGIILSIIATGGAYLVSFILHMK